MKSNLIKSAVILNLEIIGETSKHIPSSIKEKDSSSIWNYFEELGGRLTQYYYKIDLDEIWETVKFRVPEFKKNLLNLLDNLEE